MNFQKTGRKITAGKLLMENDNNKILSKSFQLGHGRVETETQRERRLEGAQVKCVKNVTIVKD